MNVNSQYQSILQLNDQTTKRDKTLEKIATGISLEMSDSASRTISDQMQNDINTNTQQLDNTNNSISMNEISNGALLSLSDQAQKLNDLSVRSNNAGLNSSDKEALQNEFQKTLDSMSSTIDSTSYNGNHLLSNSSVFPIGLNITNQDLTTTYMKNLSSTQSDIGSSTNNLLSQTNSLTEQILQTSSAKSQLSDTDIAKAINEYQNQQIEISASILNKQNQIMKNATEKLFG
jgi:flagellin